MYNVWFNSQPNEGELCDWPVFHYVNFHLADYPTTLFHTFIHTIYERK